MINLHVFCIKQFIKMKFSFFYTKNPKRFNYKPWYYNPEKEAREKRKAELGLESQLTKEEELRMKMSSRWERENNSGFEDKFKKTKFLIYTVVILTAVYIVFFTDVIDNIVRGFGVK